MTDREFLLWVHARLEFHGDHEYTDFMHKLRAIIAAIPPGQKTRTTHIFNSRRELETYLENEED